MTESATTAGRMEGEERIVPGTPYWETSFPDHIQRYRFALDYIEQGDRVLDAGCGVGYGAAEIADRRSARVTAVDIADDALDLARARFDRPNIIWCRDDCHTLDAAAAHAPFDVIINFENIEHLEDPARFIARAAALLSPDGVLLTSTPNRLLINLLRGVDADAPSANPYHVHEFSEPEFRALLSRHFGDVRIVYQSVAGRAGRRMRLRALAARLRVLPLLRAVKRMLRRQATQESHAGDHAMTEWAIEDRDRGTAWTLIAICREPRT